MTVTTGRTGHNEFTQILDDGRIVVTYHSTRIIIADPGSKTVTLRNGGWFTLSTTTHMNRSLRRLYEEVDWIPYIAVSNGGGRLHLLGNDPSEFVSHHETMLEVRVGGHA